MLRTKARNLRFPVQGLNRRHGFERESPFSTPVALNVLSDSQENGRERGGSRPGLGRALSNSVGGSRFNMLSQLTYVDATGARRECLVGAAGGNLYRRLDGETSWTQVSTSLTLASDVYLSATEHLQKLYIADYSSSPLIGTDGVITSTTTFDSATYSDWTATDPVLNANDYVVVVRSTGNGTEGVNEISAVASGSLTLSAATANATGIHFYVERVPKVYDPLANTLTRWIADDGYVPTGNPAICTWRDRVVLAGGHDAPHLWYMSRAGNADNWEYNTGDAIQAVAATNADAAKIGEPINALIPHHADCLLFGCENSIWALRGDAADGGNIHNLSYKIGVLAPHAWTKTATKATIFLSKDGLYRMQNPCGEIPESLSRELLPDELLNLDPETTRVVLEYDRLERGVFISLTAL